jgi:hypothetical protein
MMMKFAGAAAAAALCAALGTSAAASPALTLTTPGDTYSSGSYTLGFSFEVSSAQTIDQLGVYDDSGAPLAADAQVGLWDASGDLLASVDVPASGGSLVGDFRFANITPYALSTGQVYYVGSYLSSGVASSFNTDEYGSGSFNPLITPLYDQWTASESLSFPSLSDGDAGGAWLGANFNLAGGVPEPSTWAMMILGLGTIGFVARRRRQALVGAV